MFLVAAFLAGCRDSVPDSIIPTDPLTAQPRPAGPDPTAPIVKGQIVFFEYEPTGYAIFLADSDGIRLRRISPERALDINPAVSTDGKRIAYMGAVPNGVWDLYVMDADGNNRVRLTNTPGEDDRPAWSPDGNRIAFMSSVNTGTAIFVIGSDGTGLVRITAPRGNDGSPEWSSDGTRILFDRDLAGWENKGIFSMNPDGTNVTQLTSGNFDTRPTWSPDGNRIAFVRQLEGGTELFVMNADGSSIRQLTFAMHTVSDPAWSPDGRSIAFGFESASRTCVDYYYENTGETYPCGHDIMRVSLEEGVDRRWLLISANNPVWQR